MLKSNSILAHLLSSSITLHTLGFIWENNTLLLNISAIAFFKSLKHFFL